MSRPEFRMPQGVVRPPFRPRPRIVRRYEASATGSYPVEVHGDDCPCHHCAPAKSPAADALRPVDPPLPIVRLTFAAIVTANAIAFAIDPAGAWGALRAALAHLMGAR